jgi:hypothetical protein
MRGSIDNLVMAVIGARLGRSDLADLLIAPDTEHSQRLAAEVRELRGRLAQIEADYDGGLIDGRRFAVATEKTRAQLVKAETARARTSGSGAVGVLTAPDPASAFTVAPLGAQRSVIDALATVTPVLKSSPSLGRLRLPNESPPRSPLYLRTSRILI